MATPKLNGKTIEDPQLSKRIAQYVAVRDKIRADEAQVKETKKLLELVGAEILDLLQQAGIQSAKTDFGSAYIRTTHSASLSDADSFMDFVKEYQAFELLDRKANATACGAFAEEHGTLPPGVRLNSNTTVGVLSPGEK